MQTPFLKGEITLVSNSGSPELREVIFKQLKEFIAFNPGKGEDNI